MIIDAKLNYRSGLKLCFATLNNPKKLHYEYIIKNITTVSIRISTNIM